MSEKTYINGLFIKARKTQYDEAIGVSFNVKAFCDELQKHEDERGYARITILRRKEPSEKGLTHYAILDTWKPDQNRQRAQSVQDNGDNVPF